MPVIRLSRGAFPAELYDAIKQKLDQSEAGLAPGIRAMKGCLGYWAGIDRDSGTMVNISVWTTLDDAKQMESFAPMLALGREFTEFGVKFERPIVNYDVLWQAV
jgi:hypothetical protein